MLKYIIIAIIAEINNILSCPTINQWHTAGCYNISKLKELRKYGKSDKIYYVTQKPCTES